MPAKKQTTTRTSTYSQPHRQGDSWYIDEMRGPLTTVRHGPYPSRSSASAARRELTAPVASHDETDE